MKVFGIGLNKTGTTTLAACLRHLGFRHALYKPVRLGQFRRGDLDCLFHTVAKYDSFADWPWPWLYREIDAAFPGARFILTVRKDRETWFRSLCNHVRRKGPSEAQELAYGCAIPHWHRDELLALYERHNREVRACFRGRPGKLLVVCWETGSDWEDIGSFLGRAAPRIPLPHENRSVRRINWLSWTRNIACKLHREALRKIRAAEKKEGANR